MTLYIIIAFLILFGVIHFDYRNLVAGKKAFYIFIFIILTLLLAFRYRVGGDSLTYEDIYSSMPNFRDIKLYGLYYKPSLFVYQPLWLYLVAFSKWIGKDYYIFQFIHAIIVNLLIGIYIFRSSSKPFTVIFILFVTHFYFYYTIEIEREVLSIGVFLLNLKNFEKKRWPKYYFLCLISFLCHISAFILFFLPLFRNLKLSRNTIVLIVICLTPFIFFKETLESILKPLMFLDVLNSKFKDYSQIELSFLGTIYHYFGRVICLFPIFFYYKKVKSSKDYDWLFNIYIIISVLSLSFIGIERFLNYFLIPYLIIFIEYIYRMPIKINIIKKYVLILITFFNICCNIPERLLTTNSYGTPYYYLFYPYVSIFDKHIIRERENYLREQWNL